MICLHWRGTALHIEFSFFAAAALVGLLGGSILVVEIMTAGLLHELGHLFVLRCFGRHVRCVEFCGVGVTILPESSCGAYWEDVLVLLFGPAVNLVFGSVCLLCCGVTEYAMIHIGLGVFNLLPYRCLDGGSVLRALLRAKECPETHVGWIENTICLLFSISIILLLGMHRIWQFSWIAMAAYLTTMQMFSKEGRR